MNTNGKPKEDELELEEQGVPYVTGAPGLPEGLTLYKADAGSKNTNNTGGTAGGSYSYAQSAPSYKNRYQSVMDQAAAALLSRPAFTYDHNTDPMYQQYRDSYTRQGQQAMEDTLAQVSARTGGLASSYAGTAAQQTYNSYMSALADKVPELRQLAYQMYMDEGDTMRQNLSMLQGLEQTDYNRYLGALDQWNTNRQFDYNAGQDAMAQKNYLAEWDYQKNQDDKKWAQEAKQDAQTQVANYFTLGGTLDNIAEILGEDVLDASGYTQGMLALMESYYKGEQEESTPKYEPQQDPDPKPPAPVEPVVATINLGMGPAADPNLISELADYGAIKEDENGMLHWSDGWDASNYKKRLSTLRNGLFGGAFQRQQVILEQNK